MELTGESRRTLKEYITSVMDQHAIPGLSVALMRDGEVAYAEGFGYRNSEDRIAADPDTIYGIGSVTKSFTAKAVMMLAESERLSIGAPIRTYLPEFQYSDDDTSDTITIHHLLTHTSGLPPTPALKHALRESLDVQDVEQLRQQGIWDDVKRGPAMRNAEDLMDFLAGYEESPLGRPGQVFSYSNDGYALLGAIIERVSDRTYEEFVRRDLAGEVGMREVHFTPDDLADAEHVTRLYAGEDDEVVPAGNWLHAPAMVSAGFLKTTVLDLLKYGQAYLQPGLLSRGAVSMMSSPFFPSVRDTYYGYGLSVHPNYHGTTVVEHGGSIKGVSAHFGFVPQENLTAAVLINVQNAPALKVWRGLINAALDVPLDDRWGEEPKYECSPEHLTRFEGVYSSGEGATVCVSVEDGELVADINGERKIMRPSGVDTAAVMRRGEEAGVRFLTGPTGRVDAMFFGLRVLRREGE